MHPKADHGEESYKGYNRLKGRAAIITGGDSGIGRAIAIAFAREGADVLISYLPEEEEDAQETKKWVELEGCRCVLCPGNIDNEPQCKRIVDTCLNVFGKIDLLINNAAQQETRDRLEDWDTETFEHIFKVNLFAMFWLCQAALPHMKPGSSITNVASIQGIKPDAMLLPYAASKAAILNFTKSMSQLTMKKGVRCNAVAPGPVWTPLIPASFGNHEVKHFGEYTHLGRPAQPAELAPVFVFLATNDARFVTGEIYPVTGGSMPL